LLDGDSSALQRYDGIVQRYDVGGRLSCSLVHHPVTLKWAFGSACRRSALGGSVAEHAQHGNHGRRFIAAPLLPTGSIRCAENAVAPTCGDGSR